MMLARRRLLQRHVRWRSLVPARDVLAHDILRVNPCLAERLSVDLGADDVASWVSARRVRVARMLELQVETQPVHPLEEIRREVAIHLDGPATTGAGGRYIGHSARSRIAI
jgi:hypothetical protein